MDMGARAFGLRIRRRFKTGGGIIDDFRRSDYRIPTFPRTAGDRTAFHGWYRTDEKGLEKGFTIFAPPLRTSAASKSSKIVFRLVVKGSLTPQFDRSAQSFLFNTSSGEPAIRYGKLFAFDSAGHRLPSRFDHQEEIVDIIVDLKNARFPVVVDPVATSPAWISPTGDREAHLGSSVAGGGGRKPRRL